MTALPAEDLVVKGPCFLSAADTEAVLDWDLMIERMRRTYAVPEDHASNPRRVVARGDGAWLRALTAIPVSSRFMGAKVFGRSSSGRVSYLISLFDKVSGEVTALIDGNVVTAYRTAATTAAAVDRLAPPGPKTYGVLGSGAEAHAHVRALSRVRPLSSLRVYSPSLANRAAFANLFAEELGIEACAVDSPQAAVEQSELVVAAARSFDETPILRGEWLQPGMTVTSIGSTLPEQREVDERAVAVCDLIVCDMIEEVLEETGDMIAAHAQGIALSAKLLSLNEVMLGHADQRIAAAKLPMFKSVGAGAQDIAIAELALEQAMAKGLGSSLPMMFRDKRG